MKTIISILSIFLFQSLDSQMSVDEPLYTEVGKPCPDMTLRNIENYPLKQASLPDFRGRWLVLDFWNKYCVVCLESFPHVNAMQKEFGEKVRFMLVGIEDKEGEIRSLYRRYSKKVHIDLPCSFDSTLAKRFSIYSSPHIIIVDPRGVVRGVTNTFTAENMKDFLSGKEPKLAKTYGAEPEDKRNAIQYDANRPLLINDNGGKDTAYLFRSLLTPWTQGIPVYSLNNLELMNGRFEVLGVGRDYLYKMAYLGSDHRGRTGDFTYLEYWPSTILELKDTSAFMEERITGRNVYCYSLTVPPTASNKCHLMQIMQRDLKNYFGYDARIEERKMPYWRLVASEKAKSTLPTKGGEDSGTRDRIHGTLTYINHPLNFIISSPDDAPVMDNTGIHGNVDITLRFEDGLGFDKEIIRKAMEANGLYFIREEKPMKVLVIRDPIENENL